MGYFDRTPIDDLVQVIINRMLTLDQINTESTNSMDDVIIIIIVEEEDSNGTIVPTIYDILDESGSVVLDEDGFPIEQESDPVGSFILDESGEIVYDESGSTIDSEEGEDFVFVDGDQVVNGDDEDLVVVL